MSNGLNLDGTGWADGSDAGIPSGGSARTICLWFSTAGNGALLGLGDNLSNGNLLDLAIDGGEFDVQFWGNGVTAGAALDDGNPHCVMAAYTGSGFVGLFVDDPTSLAAGVSTGLNTTATGTVKVGEGIVYATRFTGVIDDICVYDHALDGTERAAYWNAGVGTDTPPSTGLVQRWKFNEASGTTAAEFIAGTNPLTLHGGATFGTGIVPGGTSSTITYRRTLHPRSGSRGAA